ncbi:MULTISPECIES: DUF1120 domain-containing protein [unclassified Pseudomonas]|uniref:DUF1120 domain-containing protein n=1 Tax=unclassified Pseudomonas TaxID=196821 RepID=UPI0015A2823A|nr:MULTISPECIES: DUF1120 domain-containing protein [unclassified Pseudomonas]NWC94509.1 DUF1120 domain-containing protein [Pseudomonas sp. IPO3779]NWD15260.1 DUF1120 domain-containing protein [Pseudomonas sp. IPO3778]
MNKLLKTVASTLLIACAPGAFAASTVDLTVTGLITPNSCTPLLSGGGQVDHGKISAKDLNTDKMTVIGVQTLQMSVSCDAAILIGLKAIDNRAGSSSSGQGMGLGLINGDQKLGFYYLYLRNPIADTVAVQPIITEDNGRSWFNDAFWNPQFLSSVGAMSDDSQPIPVRDLTVDLEVQTVIARTDGLDLSNEVPIDGSATLEVKYL